MTFILKHEHAAQFRKMLREEAERQDAAPQFISRYLRELSKLPPADETRQLICAWADGCLYGNWPWVKV